MLRMFFTQSKDCTYVVARDLPVFCREAVSVDIGWTDEVDGVGIWIDIVPPSKNYSDEVVDTGWIAKSTHLLKYRDRDLVSPWRSTSSCCRLIRWAQASRIEKCHSIRSHGIAFLDPLRSRLLWRISDEMFDTGWIARSTYFLVV